MCATLAANVLISGVGWNEKFSAGIFSTSFVISSRMLVY